jgi:hypothetical protein
MEESADIIRMLKIATMGKKEDSGEDYDDDF